MLTKHLYTITTYFTQAIGFISSDHKFLLSINLSFKHFGDFKQ